MALKLYDTLTRENRELKPADGKVFRFYCCGPTVYGPAHIGNFRTFLLQDVFRRTLEAGGMKTFQARNITDVDDKTIRQSGAEGKTLKEFTQHWSDRFHLDCEALNMLPPHVEPGAVEHIPEQIALIDRLVKKGHAYEKNGSVYYKVDSFKDYGALSRLKEREITTESPANIESDEYERESAADFALWKARKPEDGENFWKSPWGEGRPGWHIECSAMSMKYLGETMDLHSGGIDLCFPHHENEIAQSEGVTQKPFAHHWFHITHLLVDGKKMSKSLGNLYTLDDVMKKGFTPMELRYVLFSGHYRQPLNFTWDSLHAARSALEKMSKFARHINATVQQKNLTAHNGAFQKAWDALNDDLNTPQALGEMFIAMKWVETHELNDKELDDARNGWNRMVSALGIQLPMEQKVAPIPIRVQELAESRWQARLAKDWGKADELRHELEKEGWSMRDGKNDYELTPLKS